MADVIRSTPRQFPAPVRLFMLWRSLCLQASWNFERLQNLGFLYVLLPGLRRLYTGDELTAACARHLGYFNSHPYMAPTILGAVLHLETDIAAGKGSEDTGDDFKKMVMAPYAAMGDAFFWGGLRPLAAVVALFFAFRGSFWGVAVFLLMFNLPHLVFRVMGFRRGLDLGLGVIHVIQSHRLPDLAMKAKEATVILFGGLAAVLTLQFLRDTQLPGFGGFLVLPIVLCTVWLLRKRVAPLLIIYLSVACLLLVSLLL